MRKDFIAVLAVALGSWVTSAQAADPAPKTEPKPAAPAAPAAVPAAPGKDAKGAPTARPPMRDRTDFLAQYLELTDQQKEKVRPIFAEESKKIEALRKETTMTPEDRRTKYTEIREATNAKLKEVLTEAQWKKYSERGQRPPARPPGTPPPVRPAK